jgi:hypothetical protein
MADFDATGLSNGCWLSVANLARLCHKRNLHRPAD